MKPNYGGGLAALACVHVFLEGTLGLGSKGNKKE